MGVIRKIGNKWYIDVYVDGHRVRKPVGSKKDAENALIAIKADKLRGEFRFKRNLKVKFEDYAKEHLEYQKANKKPKAYERDVSSLKHLTEHFEGLYLSKITPRHIEDYKKWRLEKVTPGTINCELLCLQGMFTVAKRLGKFDGENPVKEVKKLTIQEKIMRILSKEEMDRLIDAAEGYTRALIILALNTAMRKNELLSLRWNDIDFGSGVIHIKESKTSKTRKIPINPVVEKTLKSIKRQGEFVFHNPETGTRISDFQRPFKSACETAKIEDLRIHDLRHTAATFMVMGGIDLVTVAEILGHSDIKMTRKYCHPTPENKKRAVNVLASIFGAGEDENMVKIRSKKAIELPASHLYSYS